MTSCVVWTNEFFVGLSTLNLSSGSLIDGCKAIFGIGQRSKDNKEGVSYSTERQRAYLIEHRVQRSRGLVYSADDGATIASEVFQHRHALH